MSRFLLAAVAAACLAAGASAAETFKPGDTIRHKSDAKKAPGYRVVTVEGAWVFVEDLADKGHYQALPLTGMELVKRAEADKPKGDGPKVEGPPADARAGEEPVKARKGDRVRLPDGGVGVVVGFAGGRALVRLDGGRELATDPTKLAVVQAGTLPPPREVAGKPGPKVEGQDTPAAPEGGPVFVKLHDALNQIDYFIDRTDTVKLDRIRRRIAAGERGKDPEIQWLTKPLPGPVVGEDGAPLIPPQSIGTPTCPNGNCPNAGYGVAPPPYQDYRIRGGLGGH